MPTGPAVVALEQRSAIDRRGRVKNLRIRPEALYKTSNSESNSKAGLGASIPFGAKSFRHTKKSTGEMPELSAECSGEDVKSNQLEMDESVDV